MRAVYLPTALQPVGTLPADVASPRAMAAGESPAQSWAKRAEKLIDAPLNAMKAFEAEWHGAYARRFVAVALAQSWALCEITAHTTPDAISDAFLFNAEPHGFDPALTADADVRQAREMME